MKLKPGTLVMGILLVIGITFILIRGPSDQAGKGLKPQPTAQDEPTKKLPTLIDLGKGTCIPCKKMKPILDELKIEYRGKATVEIIDLRFDSRAASKYGIRLIPTQIFFDADGNEVYRHEGFLDKQSIINKFTEMGVH